MVPTIHDELRKNGSPDSVIEADDEHTYFIIRIPCHPEFVCEELRMDKDGHILPVGEEWEPDVTDNVTDNVTDDIVGNKSVTGNVTDDVTDNVTDNVTDDVTGGYSAEKRRAEIFHLMRQTPKNTVDNLANILSVSRRTILRDIELLRRNGKLTREGEDNGGIWIVIG